MSSPENESGTEEEYDVLDEIESLDRRFQQHARYGAVTANGIVGHHAMFNHGDGIEHAGDVALYAALDEVLMELSVDPHIVRENQGEISPRTMATELREQLRHFTTIRSDRFIEQLCDEFESKLRGYQEDLEA